MRMSSDSARLFAGPSSPAPSCEISLLDIGKDVVDPPARLSSIGSPVGVADPGITPTVAGVSPVELDVAVNGEPQLLQIILHCIFRAYSRAA